MGEEEDGASIIYLKFFEKRQRARFKSQYLLQIASINRSTIYTGRVLQGANFLFKLREKRTNSYLPKTKLTQLCNHE